MIQLEDSCHVQRLLTDTLFQDRVYCKDFKKPSIFAASMGQFRDCVLRAALYSDLDSPLTIAHILNSVMLDQIRMDREGDIIDKSLLKSCVYMLEGLYETEEEEEPTKLYLTSFEPEFLVASEQFYHDEGAALLLDADAGTFCRHARYVNFLFAPFSISRSNTKQKSFRQAPGAPGARHLRSVYFLVL